MVYSINIARLVKILIIAATIVIPGNIVLAHGGKTHGDDTVTSFAVVQKGMGLYDKLISKGKLDNSWETDLKTITVYRGQRGDKSEWTVKFFRTNGAPEAVYIFFNNIILILYKIKNIYYYLNVKILSFITIA